MTVTSTASPRDRARLARRRRRIARELEALWLMSQKLWVIELSAAFLALPFIAVLCVAVLHRREWTIGTLPTLLAVGFGLYAALWWIARHWRLPVRLLFWVFWLSLVILTMSFGDPPLGSSADGNKEPRRAKLKRAIARREALLRALEANSTTTT